MALRPVRTREQSHLSTKPDQQGKFDGLCGVYAILNSLKLLYRLPEEKLEAMFRALCESLPPTKFPAAIFDGLEVPEMRHLLEFTRGYLANKHSHNDFRWKMPFEHRRFTSSASFWRAVKEEIS